MKSSAVRHSRFKAIFFDAGGTLLVPHPSVGEIYSSVAAKYGCNVSPDVVENAFREQWERRDRIHDPNLNAPPQERRWWYELVRDVFSRFDGVADYESFFEELYDIFARPEYWRLFPEAVQVVRALREQGYVLGIVSNWDERLIPLCEKLGLAALFDFILASGLVGSSKPHAGIFLEALKCSRVKPHEALHVGDSLKDDVQGPVRVGMNAVLIDRTGSLKYPVPTIRSLSEIFALLNER